MQWLIKTKKDIKHRVHGIRKTIVTTDDDIILDQSDFSKLLSRSSLFVARSFILTFDNVKSIQQYEE